MTETGAWSKSFSIVRLAGPALVTNCEGIVVWANDALCQLLRAERVSLVGAPLAAVLGEPAEMIGSTGERYLVRDDSGRRLWLHSEPSRWEDPVAGPHILRCLTDLSEFESRARSRAAALSGRDSSRLDETTGALNRLSLLQSLEAEISRSRRYGNPLSALLVRLSPGEVSADERLRAVLGRINDSLRWVDSVGRVSERELVVLLPETDLEGARRVAAKLEEDAAPSSTRVSLAAAAWNGSDGTEAYVERLRSAQAIPTPV